MKLKEGFSKFDLKGVLFVEFPVELSWQECRDRLELMIMDAADHFDPEGEMEPMFSPMWIAWAFSNEARKAIRKMTAKERRDAITEAWACREERKKAYEARRK